MGSLSENRGLATQPITGPADPPGWDQGVIIGPSGGQLTTRRLEPVAPEQWAEVLAELLPPGFDPADYRIDGDSVQVRTWDTPVGNGQTERCYYFRAHIRPTTSAAKSDEDLVELRRLASRRKPRKPIATTGARAALVVALSDWQVGKGEGGGTVATVERIHDALDAALERAKHERPASIVLAGLGDLAEGCSGWYPTQLFAVDLDEREQMRVCTRLLLSAIDRFAGWPITVSSCISNHGEKRDGGKQRTGPTDNRDLELLDRVADVLDANPARYADVRLVGPTDADPAVTTLEAEGVRIATAHGHVGFRGQNASTAAEGWWMRQIRGQRPAMHAELLLTGHRHHLALAELGLRRTWVQAPAMDGGSTWYATAAGAQSHPGMLSILVGDDVGRSGVQGLVVH